MNTERRWIVNRPGDHVRLSRSRYGHLVIPVGRRWLVRLYYGRTRYCIVRRFHNLTTEQPLWPFGSSRRFSLPVSSPHSSRDVVRPGLMTDEPLRELRTILHQAVELIERIEHE
jgi:hypothetical protein